MSVRSSKSSKVKNVVQEEHNSVEDHHVEDRHVNNNHVDLVSESIDEDDDSEDGDDGEDGDDEDDEEDSDEGSEVNIDLSDNDFYKGLCTLLEDENGNNIVKYIDLLCENTKEIADSVKHMEGIRQDIHRMTKLFERFVSLHEQKIMQESSSNMKSSKSSSSSSSSSLNDDQTVKSSKTHKSSKH